MSKAISLLLLVWLSVFFLGSLHTVNANSCIPGSPDFYNCMHDNWMAENQRQQDQATMRYEQQEREDMMRMEMEYREAEMKREMDRRMKELERKLDSQW